MTEEIYEMNDDTWNMIYRRASLPDSQKPYDKTSHERHIECDTVSHDKDISCWTCIHCELIEDSDGRDIEYCHHDDVRSSKELPVKDCPLWSHNNG